MVYLAIDPASTHQLYLLVWDLIEQVKSRGFVIDFVMVDGGSANRSLTSLVLAENSRAQGLTTPNISDISKSITLVQDMKHCTKNKKWT